MKNKLFLFAAILSLFALASCETEEGPRVSANVAPSLLTAPAVDAVLVFAKSEPNIKTKFSWTSVDFGFQASVNYTVQAVFTDALNNTSTVSLVSANNLLDTALTNGYINGMLLSIGVPGGDVSNVKFQVIANVIGATSLAMPISTKVSTYLDMVPSDWIYLVGTMQKPAWAPSTANDSIKSKIGARSYEGIVNWTIVAPSYEGKFCQHKAWDNGYSWGLKAAGSAELDSSGGASNIPFLIPAVIGSYHLTCNLNSKTYSIESYNVGVFGTATPTGTDADTKLIYNNAYDVWELSSIVLTAGQTFGFRLNDATTKTWGGTALNNIVVDGPASLPVAATGEYSITLDLKSTIKRCILTLK